MIHNGQRKLPYDVEAAHAHLRAKDKKLAGLMDRVQATGGFTLKLGHGGTPFTSLIESILYQQLHGKAAATIHKRMLALYGDENPTPAALLDTPEEILRGAGISSNKIKALKDLAAHALDGTVPGHAAIEKLSDTEIIERLTAVRGIGSWTVEMLLIFRMGRPDVLPVTDYGIRKGFALTFLRVPKSRALKAEELPKPEVLLKRGQKWAPYRSVAAWYLWRACDLEQAAITSRRVEASATKGTVPLEK